MWSVYILLNNKKNKTYIGSTNNFKNRIEEHNRSKVISTKNQGPWIPIYLEFYPDEISARERERKLKTSAGRRYLKKIINDIIEKWANNPIPALKNKRP